MDGTEFASFIHPERFRIASGINNPEIAEALISNRHLKPLLGDYMIEKEMIDSDLDELSQFCNGKFTDGTERLMTATPSEIEELSRAIVVLVIRSEVIRCVKGEKIRIIANWIGSDKFALLMAAKVGCKLTIIDSGIDWDPSVLNKNAGIVLSGLYGCLTKQQFRLHSLQYQTDKTPLRIETPDRNALLELSNSIFSIIKTEQGG